MGDAPAPRDLRVFVPRLVTEWLEREPDRRHRSVDGSMVFVDISGFTKMSERLARMGREGAERVTSIVGETFEHLLEVAYDMEGSLLSFGGDALLLFFAGDDHAVRACVAAHGMRARLRQRGTVETPVGRVRLRMTSGVHSGAFDFFLVGDSHRELLVVGPAATAVVDTEGAAATGEIRVSATTAGMLPHSVVRRLDDGGLALRRSPPPPPRRPLVDKTAVAALVATCIPAAIRAHLEAGGEGSEHRSAALAFLHFDGTDDAAAADPDRLASHLHELVSTTQRACADHGLTFLASDIDRDGGKLIVVSGAPVAHENQEERLLRAMRDVLDAQTSLPTRIGMFSGPVFSGEVGPFYRRTYTCMGDTVNTAARIMARAGERELLTTGEVLARSTTIFESETLEPFMAKGKAAPITPVRVGPITGARRDADELLPLAGRSDEIQTLDTLTAEMLGGTTRLAEIIGDTGSGKTRLVQELQRRRPHVTWVTAWAERYETSTPYFVLRQLLAPALGVPPGPELDDRKISALVASRTPELAPWTPLIGAALGCEMAPTPEVRELDPRFHRARLHAAVAALLEAVVTEPIGLVVEDGEWLDEPTAAFLGDIADRLPTTPLLVIVARRPEAVAEVAGPHLTLEVGPLDEQATKDLAHVAAGVALRPDQLATLVERAGGNPLFLRQMAAAVVADPDHLPDTVESSVLARIDALEPGDRALLRRLAVLGRSFDRATVDHVVGASPRDLLRLHEFVERTDDGWWFRQALYREVAYATLPFRDRADLHLAAAQDLEERAESLESVAATVASHYEACRRHADTLRVAEVAAAHAEAVHARVDAAVAHRQALAAGRAMGVDDAQVARAAHGVAENLAFTGDTDGALAATALARRHAGTDRQLRLRLAFVEADLRAELGQAVAAVRWTRRGRRLGADASGNEELEQVVLLIALEAEIRTRQDRVGEAVALLAQASELATRIGATRRLAAVLNSRFLLGLAVGDPDALVHARAALELAERSGMSGLVGSVTNNLAMLDEQRGEIGAAIERFGEAAAALERVGDVTRMAVAGCNRARLLCLRGSVEEGLADLDRHVPVLRSARSAWADWFEAMAEWQRSRLGEVDPDGALRDAVAPMTAVAGAAYGAEIELWRAEVLLRLGADDRADAVLTRIHDDVDDDGRGRWATMQAVIALRAGDPDAATARLEAGLSLCPAASLPWERLTVLEALAHTLRASGSRPQHDAVVAEFDDLADRLGVVTTDPVAPLTSLRPTSD